MYTRFEFSSKEAAQSAIERTIAEGWTIYQGSATLERGFCDLLGHGIHMYINVDSNENYYLH